MLTLVLTYESMAVCRDILVEIGLFHDRSRLDKVNLEAPQ